LRPEGQSEENRKNTRLARKISDFAPIYEQAPVISRSQAPRHTFLCMNTSLRASVRSLLFAAVACGSAPWLAGQSVTSPFITTQPASRTIEQGGSVTFTVVAGGTAPLTYQWRRGNQDISGQTGTSLTLTNVQPGDAASYSVIVLNSVGTVTSSPATLTVTVPGVAPTLAAPVNQTVGQGTNVELRIGITGGTPPFSYLWRKNGATVPGATGATLVLPNVGLQDSGSYTVVVSNNWGIATSGALVLTVLELPRIVTPITSQSAAPGSNVSFTVSAAGAPPLRYQWSKDNRAITGATNATLLLNSVTADDGGSYLVTVSNDAGSVQSGPVTLTIVGGSRIVNLSVRTSAGTESETLIVGFVVAGIGNKPMLVRGIGPSLAAFSVPGFLADPTLELFRGEVRVAANDNWGDSLEIDRINEAMRQTGAFAIGARSLDAVVYSTLQAGAYSVQVSPRPGTAPGVALVELYDTASGLPARVMNVSARALVGSGDRVLIAGFVISGTSRKTVLVRAIGPALAAFGVTGTLGDPQLALNSGSTVVSANDDWWRDNGAQQLPPVFNSVGAFALVTGTRDAALVALLEPGAYTATVSGAAGSAGVALVEVYEVP
jgi:hypothetical protein